MKKLAAILLLSLLAFNWYGYRLLSAFLEHRATTEMEARLDQDHYNEEDLVEIRVPLNLPYQTNWKEFERFDGELEINGVHYQYVKRKVEDGHLVVLCIPNESKQKLQTTRDEFFKLVNDLTQTDKKGNNSNQTVFKSITAEFLQSLPEWKMIVPQQIVQPPFSSPECDLLSVIILTSEQPPDA